MRQISINDVQTIIEHTVLKESKAMLLNMIMKTIENNPDVALEGELIQYNKMMERYGNDPYADVAELKYYEPDDYDDLVVNVKNRVKDLFDDVTFKGPNIIAYRAMKIDNVDEFINCLKSGSCKTGIYWTYDVNKAIPYWKIRGNGTKIIIKALIPLRSVNMLRTIKANTSSAFSKNEHEINVSKGKPIHVLTLQIDDDKTIAIDKLNIA